MVSQWFSLPSCPPLRRFAFGAVLFQFVEDREDGYRQISAYLPAVKLDAKGSSDFSYQINRPRDSRSGVPGLQVNRLCRWSVAQLMHAQVSLSDAGVQKTELGSHFACRLEMDINTSAEFRGELSPEQSKIVFGELLELGAEIAQQGDIP